MSAQDASWGSWDYGKPGADEWPAPDRHPASAPAPSAPGNTLTARLEAETGRDIQGMLREYGAIHQKIGEKRAELNRVKAEAAMLEARYDSKGQQPSHWDTERKRTLAECKEDARVRYSRNPDTTTNAKGEEKEIPITDWRTDDMAHADPRYVRFLETTLDERKEYARLRVEIDRLYGELEVLQGVREYLKHEVETNKAMIYAYGREPSE